MFLEKISLRNFRRLENLEVEFHPRTSVVVGANGAGKTMILEAAAVALGALFIPLDDLAGRRIDKRDARLTPWRGVETDEAFRQFPVEVSAIGKIDGKSLKWKRSLNGKGGNTTIKDAKTIIDVAKGWQKRMREGDAKLTLPIVAYYGTGRLWDYHREKKNDSFRTNVRTNGYIDALDGSANVKLMLNWFRKKTIQEAQKIKRGEINKSLSELDSVYLAMETCYVRMTARTGVKIEYNLDANELDVYYDADDGLRMRIPLSQLSDGYKSTISLVADIAYRMVVLNPQLGGLAIREAEGVVLIDEIDLHLHPSWQQRILGDLQAIFPKVQFIVSTHAPAVINTVKSENLIIIDELAAREPEGEVYGKDANSIFSGIMKASERPPEIAALFKEFGKAIDEKKIESASSLLEEIERKIGNDDGELVACRVELKLLQIESSYRDQD